LTFIHILCQTVIWLIEHVAPNLVGWIQIPVEPYQRLEKRYLQPIQLCARY